MPAVRREFAVLGAKINLDEFWRGSTREVEALHDIADVFRRHPRYAAPDRIVDGVRRILDSGRFRVLN